MKIVVIVLAIIFLYTAFDTAVGLAREFEHDGSEVEVIRETREYHSMIATAYCIDGITASNTHTRPGICASKREWFGKTAKIYRNVDGHPGELIGVYTIEDTGGRPIRNGSVIDIWLPTEDECFQFGKKLVLVTIE